MKKYRLVFLFFLILALCAGSGRASQGDSAGFIALTFDDGPSGCITRKLLDGLERRGARATFFLCGYRLEEYPKIAPLIAAGGHEIGLHGYSHKSMKSMDSGTLQKELHRTRELILRQTGKHAYLLRPPGGCCGDAVDRIAKAEGMPIVLWNLDTKDWTGLDAAAIAGKIIRQAKDGDIVLLHDMKYATVDGVLQAVDALTEKGFVFVTVSELAELRGTELKGGAHYLWFPAVADEGAK